MKKILIISMIAMLTISCNEKFKRQKVSKPKSTTGISKIDAKVKTGSDGATTEQRNIKRRVEAENMPGAIKHLYVISAMSGQVILYSTVLGKVTSSGKRLTPTSVQAQHVSVTENSGRDRVDHYGSSVNVGGKNHMTSEVLQDDGTYGTSIPYLFWFDAQDRYHQHYPGGGQIIHVSNEPMPVKSITINLENTKASTPISPPITKK